MIKPAVLSQPMRYVSICYHVYCGVPHTLSARPCICLHIVPCEPDSEFDDLDIPSEAWQRFRLGFGLNPSKKVKTSEKLNASAAKANPVSEPAFFSAAA